MVALRERMQEHYADWREDLPEQSGWRAFFEHCPPLDFTAFPEAHQIADDAMVWPGRRRNRPDAAPVGSHFCRPFDGIEPAGVRVIILGEDPYPSISSATGRAFEDGTPDVAGEALKLALRVLGQSAIDLSGQACPAGFCHGMEGRNGAIQGCFDRLVGQGVLCLNASWTYTAKDHKSSHRRLWSPVTAYLIQRLVERPEGPPMLLLLGTRTERFFDSLHLHTVPQVVVVRSRHPSERKNRYFAEPNPLQRVNEALQERNDNPVTWWSMPAEGELI